MPRGMRLSGPSEELSGSPSWKPFCVRSQLGKKNWIRTVLNSYVELWSDWKCCWPSPGLPQELWVLEEAKLPHLGVRGGEGCNTCYEELKAVLWARAEGGGLHRGSEWQDATAKLLILLKLTENT